MALQLTALQQHCLAGIGISTWHQRHITTSHQVKESVAHYANAAPQESTIALQESYSVVNEGDIHAKAQIDKALAYIASFDKSAVTWRVDSAVSTISSADNELILPNLPHVLSDSSLKKQLWSLLTGGES